MSGPRATLKLCLAAFAAVAPSVAAIDLDSACLDCHGDPRRQGQAPTITGQQREYLEAQLVRFKARHRESFPMSSLVAAMDEQTLGALAAQLASRAWRTAPGRMPPLQIERGSEAATVRDCRGCHGARYLGVGVVPRLAGQDPVYLARQIESFGAGHRYHPPSGTGAAMRTIGEREARDLAAYLGAFGGD